MEYKINAIKSIELAKGINGKYVHSDNMTVGFVTIEKDAILPAHSHVHEQFTQVISGKLQMTIGEITKILVPGSITLIPSNVVHSAIALTNCEVTDTFYPIREDYK